jgi:hypothetical protein
MKFIGAIVMFIALMLAVYIGTSFGAYMFHGGLYRASIVSIMMFALAVFVGMMLALWLGKFGYSIFSGKVPS